MGGLIRGIVFDVSYMVRFCVLLVFWYIDPLLFARCWVLELSYAYKLIGYSCGVFKQFEISTGDSCSVVPLLQ